MTPGMQIYTTTEDVKSEAAVKAVRGSFSDANSGLRSEVFSVCKTSVLLIDDQPIIGEAIRRLIERESDISFHFCSDPTQAIQMALEVKPTVILQDLIMPDIDGLMLLRWFRSHPETRDIPVVVLSAKEEPEFKAEAFAQGANDYLIKLPDPIELIARIRYHSRAYSNLRALVEATTAAQVQTQKLEKALQELQQTQAQLIQTEKLSSLGQMLAGIAHEINNPVNFLHGNLKHVDEYVHDLLDVLSAYQDAVPEPSDSVQQKIDEIDLEFVALDLPKTVASMKIGTDRIREIVLSLRNFSRLDESERKAVNIHEGLDSTLLILNHRTKAGICITKEYGDLPLVECFPSQLNQVFMNILNNAMDALLEQGDEQPKNILIRTMVLEGDRVRISIKDNGPGIPEEIRTKVFAPFFTTKPINQGTGLGLAISQQIVEKHQGQIQIWSEPHQGTEFWIDLQAHPAQASAAA